MVPPPASSTFTISMRRESNTSDFDLGHPASDDEFVVIECPNDKSSDSTSDVVVVGSCEPQAIASRDTAESDSIVATSETIPSQHSQNSIPH